MNKRMKKLGCLFLALNMSCQTMAMAAAPGSPDNGTAGLNKEVKKAIQKQVEKEGKKEAAESPYIITDEEELSRLAEPEQQHKEVKSNALPPQMGWSSWNSFHQNINEETIRGAGKALINSKLNEYGYTYLNMDDCWQSSMRDEEGRMQFDLTSFPSGPAFIKELNEMAGKDSEHPLKVGVYSSCGDYTCEDLTASYGNEELDAQTFAEWGIEYLKYDYCHVVDMDVDSGYITKAPDVDYITVAKANTPESQKYQAEDAKLAGNASKQGWYVTGLNAGGGSVTFEDVTVPEDGRYVLSIGFYKTYSKKKFAEVVVNDSQKYETTFAQTSGWNNTGRQQLYVDLKAGANTIKIHNPIKGQREDSIRRYTKMGNALKAATAKVAEENGTEEKPIFYSVCEHGRTQPWTWAQDFASSWRVAPDINSNWNTIINRYDISVNLWEHQKPGAYNDPDMLEVGNGTLTNEENKAHFTLWCMISAPLILGNDIRKFVKEDGTIDREACNGAYDIVTNEALIEVNQAMPLMQCKRVSQENNVDILVKPLANEEMAICFFNRGTSATSIEYDLSNVLADDSRVELPSNSVYMITDLWDTQLGESIVSANMNSGEIPGHGVRVYKVRSASSGDTEKLAGFKVLTDLTINTGEAFTVSAEVENLGRAALEEMDVTIALPEGFTAVKTSENKNTLLSGEKEILTWTVTAPSEAASGNLAATLSYKYDDEAEPQTKTINKNISVMQAPQDTMVLGDMEWLSATDGWKKEPARNKSIGGNKLSIQGTEYESGVGTNAESEIKVYLGGKTYRFTAVAGIDDEAIEDYNITGAAYQPPQVTFELEADGVKIYDSGLINMENPVVTIDETIESCRELILRVTEGGNTNSYDHADWADARFEKADDVVRHGINIEATEHGKITTKPAVSVKDGENLEIIFTPDKGYQAGTAVVNGEEVVLTDGGYLLEQVTSDVTIGGTFVPSEVEEGENIARSATASSPAQTAANSGPERANDGDIDTAKNGFAILENQEDGLKYLQYDWEEGQDIESLEILTTYGAVRGVEEMDVLVSHDGENYATLTTWSGLKWNINDNIIESNEYKLSKEEKEIAQKVKSMKFMITKTKYAWGATVIMELKVMGKPSEEIPVPKPETFAITMNQPVSGGAITAVSEGKEITSGTVLEKGKDVIFTFHPSVGFTLAAAYLNGGQVAAKEGHAYEVKGIDTDLTASAEFAANSITGSVDMGDTGDQASGILVTLKNTSSEIVAQTETGQDGTYRFSEIPYGEYVVQIQDTDRYTAEKVTVVLEGQEAFAEAVAAVLRKADKTALEALIREMESINVSDCTVESVNSWKAVLEEAKTLVKEDLTVDDAKVIADMIAKLKNARNGLIKKPVVDTSVGSTSVKTKGVNYKTVEVSWKSAKNASGYLVYRKTAGSSWKQIKDVRGKLSCLDHKAITGRKYQYAVKPYGAVDGKKVYGSQSKAVTGKAILPVPKTAAKAFKKAVNKITWKKIAGAQKYVIYRKETTKKAKWKQVGIAKSNAKNYLDKKAKKGKKYYYAVKAYRKASGKNCYSSYGISKKVKTKK